MSDVKPSREEIVKALMGPVHAPLSTHDPRDGACLQCPWPLHAAGSPEEIADAILALLPGRSEQDVLYAASVELRENNWPEAARLLEERADR